MDAPRREVLATPPRLYGIDNDCGPLRDVPVGRSDHFDDLILPHGIGPPDAVPPVPRSMGGRLSRAGKGGICLPCRFAGRRATRARLHAYATRTGMGQRPGAPGAGCLPQSLAVLSSTADPSSMSVEC